MLSPEVAGAFFAAALVLSIAPGPDNIFVLTQSALYGAAAGMVTTLGLATGLCFHTTAVALGVAVIFRSSPTAFWVLKILGACYLLYLAWLAFRSGAALARVPEGADDAGGAASFPGYGALYRRGILMNVTNPKVCLFFLAFLPQFCEPERGSIPLQVVLLGALFILATLLVFFSVALLGGRLARRFNASRRGQILINRLAGLVFLGLAVALLATGQ
ncbi:MULTISPECIES: LysE family translocator [unclassified Desulfovibrio]|uniref:LysE family translocator n=1 Tax=unclassified Desulfovibrio TaxID=2593640 RepID=UPI0013EBDA55|nr:MULTISPECIES: LysE family translocator [unclassified Desulfovibrio]